MLILAVAPLALVVEAMFGYPNWIFRAIGHPVTWMGRVITFLERYLNDPNHSFLRRRGGGAVALLLLLILTGGTAVAVQAALVAQPLGALFVAVIASSLLAQRSLHLHVVRVAEALERQDLDEARRAVGRLVGRDTNELDEAGVRRAAIESLAENFSDGVVAPALWLTLAGLPGGVLYKAINTADSMVGHRTARYEAYGWAAARLDDLANLPASRLSALFLIVAAVLLPEADAHSSWKAVRRDARNHRSPNAGWPEAAMAGALSLRLAGPRSYAGVHTPEAYMGQGRRDPSDIDLRYALKLFRAADFLLVALVISMIGLISIVRA